MDEVAHAEKNDPSSLLPGMCEREEVFTEHLTPEQMRRLLASLPVLSKVGDEVTIFDEPKS